MIKLQSKGYKLALSGFREEARAMPRVANMLLGAISSVILAISAVLIVSSLFMQFHGATQCHKSLVPPLLVVGLVFFIIAMLGFVGSFHWSICLSEVYQTLVIASFLCLLGFTIFAIVVIREKGSRHYSHWMERRVVSANSWNTIKSCLKEAKVCGGLGHVSLRILGKRNLNAIQWGCCKPPRECGLKLTNATYSTVSKLGTAAAAPARDCRTWSNDENRLCYDCNSCKASFVAGLKMEWKNITILSTLVLIVLLTSAILGCSVHRINRSRNIPYATL